MVWSVSLGWLGHIEANLSHARGEEGGRKWDFRWDTDQIKVRTSESEAAMGELIGGEATLA